MKIKILTDSTADLSPHDIDKYDIGVIPLQVHFGNISYLDKVDLNTEEFFEKLAQSKVNPTTSQPSMGAFIQFFEQALADHDLVIYVAVSQALSGTYSSAKLAQAQLDDERLLVIDSQNVTFSLGLIVLALAQRKERIQSKAQSLRLVEILKSELQSFYIADTLEYLIRGGRLGRLQGTVGTILGIKPILSADQGKLVVVDKARGLSKAMDQVLAQMEQIMPDRRLGQLGIFHSMAPELAAEFESRLRQRFEIGQIHESMVGSVVGTHAGPGSLAVAFFRDCNL